LGECGGSASAGCPAPVASAMCISAAHASRPSSPGDNTGGGAAMDR
jgi:hypothetical protein